MLEEELVSIIEDYFKYDCANEYEPDAKELAYAILEGLKEEFTFIIKDYMSKNCSSECEGSPEKLVSVIFEDKG